MMWLPKSVEEARRRLRARAEEARLRALEYDGDPIEDMSHILPEDLSAEDWAKIVSEPAYESYWDNDGSNFEGQWDGGHCPPIPIDSGTDARYRT